MARRSPVRPNLYRIERNHGEPMSARIVRMADQHGAAVLDIYRAGIAEGNATFETEPPPWPAFSADRLPEHRFVAVDDTGAVLGWVACSRFSERCAYAGVVDHSVYVDPGARGRGIGRLLRTPS